MADWETVCEDGQCSPPVVAGELDAASETEAAEEPQASTDDRSEDSNRSSRPQRTWRRLIRRR